MAQVRRHRRRRQRHLQLTAADALTAASTDAAPAGPATSDPAFLLNRWQRSIVMLWTPTTRASGFLIDARGLVMTSQRAVAGAARVHVQLTPALKVAARVLAADAARDVAVLWIDPEVVAGVAPVPLDCESAERPAMASNQEVVTIGVPMRGPTDLMFGMVTEVVSQSVIADFGLETGAAGGPVFATSGSVIGLTSLAAETNDRSDDTPVVRLDSACEVAAAATAKLQGTPAPDRTRLPVEPVTPFPLEALRDAVGRRAGNLNPYQLAADDFDVAFITPVHTYAAQNPPMPATARGRGSAPRTPPPPRDPVPSLREFGRWSEYVFAFPPVLIVRATPKAVEGFWAKIGRAAASTQGVALPAMKRVTTGFARLRAFCGTSEVAPIHPFTIDHRVSETETVAEGLYVFDPSALGPECGSVRLELYSQKAPNRADMRVVDKGVLTQVHADFAPHRAAP